MRTLPGPCPPISISYPCVPRPRPGWVSRAEPIRLVRSEGGVRARGVRNPDLDPTDALLECAVRAVGQLGDIAGYILKNRSPSCGMERVKVYTPQGMPVDNGSGIYAAELMRRLPLLPVEEEGRLGDPVLRENFVERVFVYRRWQRLLAAGVSAGRLVDFHADHKYLIMAHSQDAYRKLGRLVADAGRADLDALAAEYATRLMEALRKPATPRQHVNVLQHLLGYLKNQIDGTDREEMVETIEQYRQGLLPLIVPITLIRHHFRRHPDPYVLRQYYLSPHPKELMLRNRI